MIFPVLKKLVGRSVRLLAAGVVSLTAWMPVAVFAQPCDLERMENCEAGQGDAAASADGWQGPTLRSRIRLYGGFESIDPPGFANDDSRLNDAYVRRADLTFRVALQENTGLYYKSEHNEAELDIRDAYFYYDSGIGRFTFGLLDPIDESVDPSYREFLESSAVEGFAPGNQLGVALFSEGENWTFYAAALKHTIDKHQVVDAGAVYSVRFTIAPPVPEGYLLHLGGYASTRRADKDERLFRYSATSLFRQGEEYIDTGRVVDEEQLVGLELGLNIGSTSFDGQCAVLRVSAPAAPNARSYLDGCYLAGIWTLTGEPRYYGGDGFTLLRVNSSVFQGGTGAWQVGARYDTVDLSDGYIQGGAQDTWTYSINWYLNGQLWVSGNYSRAKLAGNDFGPGRTDGWGARVQYLFEW